MYQAKNPPANSLLASPTPWGVFFGRRGSQYVVKPEDMDGHVLVAGIPGSGKSSCVAIPTLQSWQGSAFGIDLKGELYEHTHQHRRNVKVFAPQDKTSPYRYDPYVFLNQSVNPAQDALAIAQAILPLPPNAREPFWIKTAQLLLTGAILHFHHQKYNFIDALRKIQSYSPDALIKIIAESPNDTAKPFATTLVGADNKLVSGISAEISRAILVLITNNDITNVLTPEQSKHIISPADLESGHDIYIKIPIHLLHQWKPLLTLMVNQFITFFKQRSKSRDNRPILFMLAEFPSLGKVPAITDTLPIIRSKKITICLIIQSLAQLKLIYGRDAQEVIADTCAFKAVLGATGPSTQEYFSKLVGTYDKIRPSQTYNKNAYGTPSGSSTSFADDNEKRIIKPEEFAYLQDIILLYPLPLNFCRVQKQFHYTKNKTA
jgi:type IV secretion system protein VirD4